MSFMREDLPFCVLIQKVKYLIKRILAKARLYEVKHPLINLGPHVRRYVPNRTFDAHWCKLAPVNDLRSE
jgi:hypothetical protein